jgi:hypothetical protein
LYISSPCSFVLSTLIIYSRDQSRYDCSTARVSQAFSPRLDPSCLTEIRQPYKTNVNAMLYPSLVHKHKLHQVSTLSPSHQNSTMPNPQIRPLEDQILRTAALFQSLAAFPIAFFLGTCAWFQLFDYYEGFYYFLQVFHFYKGCSYSILTVLSSDSITALMASGIIFIVIVQRKIVATKLLTLQFEAVKTFLATGLWVWLLIDSAIGRWPQRRMPRAFLASLLLV